MSSSEPKDASREARDMCEAIRIMPSQLLTWATLVSPETLSSDIKEHIRSCDVCANTVLTAQREWIAQHPEEQLSAEETEKIQDVLQAHLAAMS
jgi:uncharacterized damage-inducible protein DinB